MKTREFKEVHPKSRGEGGGAKSPTYWTAVDTLTWKFELSGSQSGNLGRTGRRREVPTALTASFGATNYEILIEESLKSHLTTTMVTSSLN